MVFSFFKERILNKKRKHALTEFRKALIKALDYLIKNAKNETEKNLYEEMKKNVIETALLFFPRKTLRTIIQKIGDKIIGIGATMGEHVNQIQLIQKGNHFFLIRKHHIRLPAEHIFAGDKLSIDGVFTLSHEYAHFPKKIVKPFALSYGLTLEQAEELLADVLAAKVAITLGYKKETILKHFQGREIVYGLFPFKEFIKKALL